LRIALALCLTLFLAGCAVRPTAAPTPQQGVSIRGNVHGGQQPIVGSHIYLFAANTTGYGQPSVSLLSATSTGLSDSKGAYVLSDSNGGFTITGDYTCTTGTQVYLYALGGNPGAGDNSAAGLLAILGQCPASGTFASTVPFVSVNEVSTIAAAYSMAGFATDATHVSSSATAAAKTGVANAFAAAASLVNLSTGAALTTTPNGNGSIDVTMINTVANILATCINSTGTSSAACSTLFSNTRSNGSTGSEPTDTATAAINIAHNPGSNAASLFALVPATAAPFAPSSTSPLPYFALSIQYGGANGAGNLAIDEVGNVWIENLFGNVTELSNSGRVLSGPNGYPVHATGMIAIDQIGNTWIAGGNNLYEVSGSGTVSTHPLSSNTTCTGIAVDASGSIWCNVYDSTSGTSSLLKFSLSGTELSSIILTPGQRSGFAIDASGNAWTGDSGQTYATSISTGQNANIVGDVSAGAFVVDAAGSVWGSEKSVFVTRFTYDAVMQSYTTSSFTNACFNLAPGLGPLAIDGSGNVWVSTSYSVCKLANDGTLIQPSNGYAFIHRYAGGLAVDSSGNVWIADLQTSYLTKLIGAATPVITPLSVALKNNAIASRP